MAPTYFPISSVLSNTGIRIRYNDYTWQTISFAKSTLDLNRGLNVSSLTALSTILTVQN